MSRTEAAEESGDSIVNNDRSEFGWLREQSEQYSVAVSLWNTIEWLRAVRGRVEVPVSLGALLLG